MSGTSSRTAVMVADNSSIYTSEPNGLEGDGMTMGNQF